MTIAMRIIIGILGCVLSCGLVRAEAFLVEAGKPRAEIIIAEAPARMTKLAARELQTYIQKISGATLPIVTKPTDGGVRIYVGVSSHTEALELSTNGLAYGAYRMASGPDWLALLGPDKDYLPIEPYGRNSHPDWDKITGDTFWNSFGDGDYQPTLDIRLLDDRGTLHAVYGFLHDLGVRWYMPGELGEVVPQLADIFLPTVNRTAKPDYAVRNMNWYKGHLSVSEEDTLWRLRLRQHLGHDVVGRSQLCHGMKFVLRRKEMKQAHPEFYALRGGQRITEFKDSGVPCLSSEGFFEKHVAYARAVFDHFGEPMISIDLPDGSSGMTCECEGCRAQLTPARGMDGSMSELVWGYLNRLAAELYKSHPDRWVSGLSYSAYALPPENVETFPPNLVMFTMRPRMNFGAPEVRASYEALREAWLKKLPSGRVFTFSSVSFNGQRGLPVYYPHLLAEDLHKGKGRVAGEMIECYEHSPDRDYGWNAQAVAHLTLYTYSRCWWNADEDIDAMLDEYVRLFYGPAAEPMRAFIAYCEQNWPRMRQEVEPIDRAMELLATAQAAVETNSVYGRRIDLITVYTQPLRARREELLTYRQDTPVVRIGERLGGELAIDGRLDEKFWSDLPSYPLRNLETGEPVEVKTTFRAFWNAADRSLVLGIRCEEPDMESLVSVATQHGEPAIFDEDAIELFIETPLNTYYQIAVDSRGFVMDLDCKNRRNSLWSSEAELATFQGQDFWNLEIRIPSADLEDGGLDPLKRINGTKPTAVEPWYFNVCRNRPRGKKSELSAFSPTGTHRFADPSKFAKLIIE